jgi:hypothetical protein
VVRTRDGDHLWERVADELGSVAQAEDQALVWFEGQAPGREGRKPEDSGPAAGKTGTRPSAGGRDTARSRSRKFFPDRAALAVIARLVVHLTRVRAVSFSLETLRRWDYATGVVVIVVLVFSTGWLLTNDVDHLPAALLIGGGIPVAWLLVRVSIVVVSRVRGRHAVRLARLAGQDGARAAVDDLLSRELAQLQRWRRSTERLGRPALAERVATEITSVQRLLRDVKRLSTEDLTWALNAELEHPEAVPKARFGRDLAAARLGRLVGFAPRAAKRLWRWYRAAFVPAEALAVLAASDEELDARILRDLDERYRALYDRLGSPPGRDRQDA